MKLLFRLLICIISLSAGTIHSKNNFNNQCCTQSACCSGCGSFFCGDSCNQCISSSVINSVPCDNMFNQIFDGVNNESRCADCDLCGRSCFTDGFKACQLECFGHTVFIPRSIGANTARELIGWQNYIHTCAEKGYYLSYAYVPGYSRSFKHPRLAQTLFGNSVINFAGSQVSGRKNCEWIADYFGLPTTFRANLTVKPVIENFYFDNQLFVGLDCLYPGFYFRAHAPIAYARWNLRSCECITSGTGISRTFPDSYMQSDQTRTARNLRQALRGDFAFGDFKGRRFGNFPFRALSKFALADIDLIFGWDFYKCNDYRLGFYMQAVAPTGNKPNPRFVFSPIVGNAKHWELGGGVSGQMLLWERDIDKRLTIYLEGNMTHMFASHQCRSFDLCKNGLFSRYVLLKEYALDGITYANNLVSAIDVTTQNVVVSVPLKGDVSIKLSYTSCWIEVDLGYNFYGHARERLRLDCDISKFERRKFGIKGTEGVFYNEYAVNSDGTFGAFVARNPLNSTQSEATISTPALTDNPQNPATLIPGDIAVAWNNTRTTGPATGTDLVLAHASEPPVLLTLKDLDLCSGTACPFITQKIFGNVSYLCNGNCYDTFIGFGGEIEFEGFARNLRNSLNQWSAWIKGGFHY